MYRFNKTLVDVINKYTYNLLGVAEAIYNGESLKFFLLLMHAD